MMHAITRMQPPHAAHRGMMTTTARSKWLDRATLFGTTLNAALALGHSLRARGGRRTAIFAALALGLPTLAEWHAVNIDRGLRHHTRPQLGGVPLGAALGWCVIASATHALVEDLLAGTEIDAATRRWATPVGAALVATSLDFALDPLGLALGLWEWRDGGPYAREITGPNGQKGIPVSNYVAWLSLIGGVTALYGVLGDRQPAPPRANSATTRDTVQLLLPYYLPAALWAFGQRQPKYLLYSALFPLTIALALRRRDSRPHQG